jgi:hypothetical protein
MMGELLTPEMMKEFKRLKKWVKDYPIESAMRIQELEREVERLKQIEREWNEHNALDPEGEPETEPCEMCSVEVEYGFSLCTECDKRVERFDERGFYVMKDGRHVDTSKTN